MSYVLVVDDEADLRFVWERAFRKAGHTVLAADGGADAIRHIDHQLPYILFVDYNMPFVSGMDVIRHLHDVMIDATTYIILLVADPELQYKIDTSLVHSILVKPVGFHDLMQLAGSLEVRS